MRVAVLHYHGRTGGVSRVIELGCEGLMRLGHEVLVLVGENPLEGVPCEIVGALRYGAGPEEAPALQAEVVSACRRLWKADADIFVIHNHSLGKNCSLPIAVCRWAAAGQPMLLHLHDVAENGRPANYRYLRDFLGGEPLYPFGGNISLSVLTRKAARAVEEAGGSAVVLPNPVVAPPVWGRPVCLADFQAERLIVYPTRAIRRKNPGEFLLHASVGQPGDVYALSGAPPAPQSGVDAGWEQLARELNLPVHFDACKRSGCSLGGLLSIAGLAMTTSVEEGFGMAFLEPVAAGLSVAGRDLPDVTGDFRREGIECGMLYSRWDIPPSLPEFHGLEDEIRQKVVMARSACGLPESEQAVEAALAAVRGPDGVDFGRISVARQRQILMRARSLGLRPPRMAFNGSLEISRRLVETKYSADAYARRLESILLETLRRPPARPQFLDQQRFLAAHLNFHDFSCLRF